MPVEEKLTEHEKAMLIDLVHELSSDISTLSARVAQLKKELLAYSDKPRIEQTLQKILDIKEL